MRLKTRSDTSEFKLKDAVVLEKVLEQKVQ